MATRSSLGTTSTPATLAVSNGTLQIEGNTVTAINLTANTTLKTNSERHIISANLVKADIKDLGDILTNPLTVDLDANGKNIENVGNLETTLINSRGILYNTSIANLNMGGFNINNSPTITTLQGKTAFITTNPEFNETVFNGPVLLNGTVSNANEILFNNGSSISANTQDLTLYSQFNIATDSNFNSTAQITCNTLNASNISVPAITTLNTKTQYQSVFTPSQATIFTGIVNATTTLAVGTAQSGQTGYNLPLSRPLIPGYVMVTPASTGNTLSFQLASDPAKVQNLTASTGQSTFSGILNVGTELKVNSLSTLVGGILSNQKISLTKNIIEIQEDGVYSQAITIGNLATTGYALPRTTNSIAGSDLRLLSDGNLSFHAPGSIRAYRVDTVPDFNTLTFASANVFVNLSGYLTTQNITNNAFTWQATGARYEGTVTRNFIADFSVILLNENKDIVPNITLTLVNITGAIDYSSQIFEHTHNRSRQWVLQATGSVAQNQIISARIRSSLALASTTIGSPQLNITLL